MKKSIVNFIDQNTLIAGLIFLTIGIILLIYQLTKKDSVTFNNSNLLSWKGYTYTWGLIIMSFIFGLILLFKD